MPAKQSVLVVDDELSMRELLEIVLQGAGYEVRSAAGVGEAMAAMGETEFDVVLTDLYMGNDREAGLRLLAWLQQNAPATPAIMITAHGSVETAVEAMRLGAADYLQKPFRTNDEIRLRVERAVSQRNLRRENEALRKEQSRQAHLGDMVGKSRAFHDVMSMVRRVAALPSTVAIHGESGVGKELVARALHHLSGRADKPFVAINCGGIPETLLESELFGYKKGAFTGAVEDKEGLFAVANGGTILLDEIGEMPMMLQVKLLRVLDNSTVTPVGGTAAVRVDVRIISATNRNLAEMVERGEFRNDLYYRLNVIPIHVPPLRDRAEDIPLLARHLLQRHAANMGFGLKEFSPEAERLLMRYPWPGNVRELGNVIERALALSGGQIEVEDLPPSVRDHVPAPERGGAVLPPGGVNLEDLISEVEREYIQQALDRSHYSQMKAASLLGLTPRSLRYRLQKYGMNAED
ncbi:MAG: sigma-54-dependent Fis family transcriptional regulator [Candidatus Hydrogenedens sp.]|nr:sigma-54-dependent Fis family transcriptional regulator [Candidatus Hydrogenedentota bacterium]NLF57655.1 sigma-54-dependent Fis family transcriptional regulator [Candidatus Hydrogenedens sp.]